MGLADTMMALRAPSLCQYATEKIYLSNNRREPNLSESI